MINKARGEVAATVGGREIVLRLTLGGLARLEAALEVKTMSALVARMSDPGVNDILIFAEVLSEGALTREDLSTLPMGEATALFNAVTDALHAAFAEPEGGKKNAEPEMAPTKSRRAASSASPQA